MCNDVINFELFFLFAQPKLRCLLEGNETTGGEHKPTSEPEIGRGEENVFDTKEKNSRKHVQEEYFKRLPSASREFNELKTKMFSLVLLS